MVDEIDNHVDERGVKVEPGWRRAALLATAFRRVVEAVHEQLADQGHPAVRPVHGFALQAVGAGATASEVAARLGVSKQAAAKTLAALEEVGYLTREADPADARRRLLVPTARGRDLLERSAAAFETVLAEWAGAVGPGDLDHAFATLRTAVGDVGLRVDLASWAG